MEGDSLSIFTASRFDRVRQWPIVPSNVPERPLEPGEQSEIAATIAGGIALIKEIVGQVDTKHRCCAATPDYYASESNEIYKFLTILLRGARTVEQVKDLIAGFVFYTIDELDDGEWLEIDGSRQYVCGRVRDVMIRRLPVDGKFKSIPYSGRMDRDPEDWERMQQHYYQLHVAASVDHWSRLSRTVVHLLEDVLSLRQARRYCHEPNQDGLFPILADPYRVFCKHFGTSGSPVDRKVPENKRMTPEKLTRFLTLPGLQGYIDADTQMADETIASNLTIIAEYICENSDAIYKNGVTTDDIDKWMRDKFSKYNPPLHLATYIWARFLGTEFEGTALWIEQYMLDLLEREHRWVFEIAGSQSRAEYNHPCGLLELYERALNTAGDSGQCERLRKLSYLIPSKELLEAAMGSKNYRTSACVRSLHTFGSDPSRYLPSAEKYSDWRYDSDFDGFCLDLFQESFKPLSTWEAIDGFELLDPMAVDGYSTSRGWTILQAILARVKKRMEEMKPSELMAFKQNVVDRLPELYQKKALYLVSRIAERWTVTASFEGHDTDTVANMAAEQYDGEKPKLILPGGIPLDALVGDGHSDKRFSAIAELAVLERHLRGKVRGGDQIIDYLLWHRGTMVPVDLVAPAPGAPNQAIIEEYSDSPDLLALLTIATLLVYLGYDYDQIMSEVRMQATLADKEKHPDVTSVGVEYEQVSATPEGQIVNPANFGCIFNVFAMGGDKHANEIKTPPTYSTFMQKYIFALITDSRFQFLFTKMLWEMTARPDRAPSSLHVSVAVPRELPFSEELVRKYMAPIHEMQWIVSGRRVVRQHTSAGYVKGWKSGALLDVMEGLRPDMQVEDKSLSLDSDGDYGKQIEMIQLLSSAAIQLMKERAGLPMTPSGRVMAQIYERFKTESGIILDFPPDEISRVAARALMERFSDSIRDELNRPKTRKTEGIVWVP
jgi:hypothetical protein